MDTFCIPVHPATRKQRKLTIQRLRDTFWSIAAAVLVLDRELKTVDSQTMPFVEFGIRVLCGGWIKRLWTLEESAFSGPEKLFFQMPDGPRSRYELVRRHRRCDLYPRKMVRCKMILSFSRSRGPFGSTRAYLDYLSLGLAGTSRGDSPPH